MAKAKKKTKKLLVDFSGVDKEIRKRSRDVPEGDYLFKVTKGEVKKNKSGDGRHILFTLQIIEDGRGSTKYAGVPKWYRCSLKPDALFNLRNFIFAASGGKKNVAGKKAVDVNPKSYVGDRLAGTIENEGGDDDKVYNSVVTVFPASELVEEESEDEDEEEEDDEDEEEEDEDEEDEEDEEEEDEEDDLEDVDDDDL